MHWAPAVCTYAAVMIAILPSDVMAGVNGACCLANGTCTGDLDEFSCGDVPTNVSWHEGASCGANPDLPSPICTQIDCSFNNGTPLDDSGGPRSQFAPDQSFAAAAADDFVLTATGAEPCVVTSVRVWVTHGTPAVFPGLHYQGVNVTIYTDGTTAGPTGRPENDGSHSAIILGQIVYTQTIPMTDVLVTQELPLCLVDLWEIEMPIHVVLESDTRYWLEVQPILDASIGETRWVPSVNNNLTPAQFIFENDGVVDWQDVAGNARGCMPSPTAGTRTNLAFQLMGQGFSTPINDNCIDSIKAGDGIIRFSTDGANTDGPDEPETCDFFDFTNVNQDVWFDYTASCSGNLTIETCGSEYDTKIALYSGCDRCPPDSFPIACDEDTCSIQSRVNLPVAEGQCFTLRVGGFLTADGKGLLSINCVTPEGACCVGGSCTGTTTQAECVVSRGVWFEGQTCPEFGCPVSHDECVNSIPLTTGVPFSGQTLGATGTDITSCGLFDSKDVWHSWMADCTGAASISLCGSSFDTTLAVFDSCGGTELGCNDDSICAPQSRINPRGSGAGDFVPVQAGVTYYIRVSGFSSVGGDYTIEVEPCFKACCVSTSAICLEQIPDDCINFGGIVGGPQCLGDGDFSGRDDACELCPADTINLIATLPPDATVDARQPNEPGSSLPLQGIGSPSEPILITLDPPVGGAEQCFALCETSADLQAGANDISSVMDLGSGVYEIVLNHAIAPGEVTTIEYLGDGSFVEYVSHPSNVSGGALANASDVSAFTECCLLGICTPAHGVFSCDIDHSGAPAPGDLLRLIDLLAGAEELEGRFGTPLPVNGTCPPN